MCSYCLPSSETGSLLNSLLHSNHFWGHTLLHKTESVTILHKHVLHTVVGLFCVLGLFQPIFSSGAPPSSALTSQEHRSLPLTLQKPHLHVFHSRCMYVTEAPPSYLARPPPPNFRRSRPRPFSCKNFSTFVTKTL